MKRPLRYGKASYSYGDFHPDSPCQPRPVIEFTTVYAEGRHWQPNPGDRTALLLLRRQMPKQVSFTRAYRGWRSSGAREERELGEGRAFLRWLQRHELSIAWESRDLKLHPYFTLPGAPTHAPDDEMAVGMSFAIAPVEVDGRRVKLYLADEDVLRLIHLPYGNDEDFLALVTEYVGQRRQWQLWKAPAPPFVEWLTSLGKKPFFKPGQLGFKLPF
ncbi:MAG: hypothetical protein ACLGG7_04050 [Bacteriovoracia bacterium]